MWQPPIAHAGGADESFGLVLLFAGLWTGWIGWSRLRGRGFDRLPRWSGGALLGLAVVLVVAAAVLPQRLVRTTPASVGSRPSSSVTIRIVQPPDGQHVDADQVTVQIDVVGGTLTTQTTAASISPDTGHLHLLVDGAIVSMSGDTQQVIDVRNLAAGTHTLTAEFVATDHLPFDPPVTASITFVKDPAASATPG